MGRAAQGDAPRSNRGGSCVRLKTPNPFLLLRPTSATTMNPTNAGSSQRSPLPSANSHFAVEDITAGDITGQQVGGELDATLNSVASACSPLQNCARASSSEKLRAGDESAPAQHGSHHHFTGRFVDDGAFNSAITCLLSEETREISCHDRLRAEDCREDSETRTPAMSSGVLLSLCAQ